MEKDILLKAEKITVQFGGLKAVNEVDMEIKRGEIHALIGPNGGGENHVFQRDLRNLHADVRPCVF